MNMFEKLEEHSEEVGEKVLLCFDSCLKNFKINSKTVVNVYELATGIKSFSRFSKDRLLVRGLFEANNGYTFSPWKRYSDGSYGLDRGEEVEFKLSTDAKAEIIGEIVMRAFEAARQLN